MVIFKQPGIGGEVRWHQDASFFVTTPITVTTFWFALEDATLDNGCLWVQPGGHRGPLRERFVREGDELRAWRSWTPRPGRHHRRRAVEVAAGTLVSFTACCRTTARPTGQRSRGMAYTLHVTDGSAVYAPQNWLRRQRLPLRGFV
jgi:phytanoyl-CoA hydroxylase